MKQTIKKKQLFKEIIILSISSVIVLLSICYTILPINIGLINTTLNHEDWLNLIINLFTIQATIATLSISIIAIITGFQSKSVCGITITHYVTTLKPCILKHKILMIADLIITAINYFVVAYSGSNISISLFIVSVIISCVLIIDTSFVFKKSGAIEKEIYNYILENYNEKMIDDLGTSVRENATTEKVNELEYELSVINDLFKNELNKSSCKTTVLDKIEKILINCFLSSYLSNNKEIILSILKSINKIYESANSKNDSPYPVDVWSSICFQYMTFIGTVGLPLIKNHQKFNYLEFRYQIQKNLVFENRDNQQVPVNNSLIEYYYVMVYQKMLNNHCLSKDEFEGLKTEILSEAYNNVFWRTNNDNQKDIDIKGICCLIKVFIEAGEIELLKSQFLQQINHTLNKPLYAFVFLTSVIYAYYLAYNEPYVKDAQEQENAISYLRLLTSTNSKVFDFRNAIYRIDFIKLLENPHYNFFSLMRNWEKYKNGVVKTIRLEPTITECLFFICIEKYYNEEKLADCFRLFTGNQVLSLIMNFFSNDSSFEEQYTAFRKNMFGQSIAIDKKRVLETKSLVRGALAREYKIELNEQAEKRPLDNPKIQKFRERLTAVFNEKKSVFDIFIHNEFPNQRKINKSITFPYIDYYDLENDTSSFFEQCFSEVLFKVFFNTFASNINTIEINYQSKEKQNTLINMSKKIIPDTFIGNRETFWEEDDKDKLKRFSEKMTKIDDPYFVNEMYLLNSKNILFNITNVSFKISDCTIDDFDNLGVEKQGDVYLYSRLENVIKIPYTKEELLLHLKQTRKRLVMTFDVISSVNEEIVGCGIKITYNEDEEANNDIDNSLENKNI